MNSCMRLDLVCWCIEFRPTPLQKKNLFDDHSDRAKHLDALLLVALLVTTNPRSHANRLSLRASAYLKGSLEDQRWAYSA